MELLVDALTTWDLVIGQSPAVGAADSTETHFYFISYPEYLFLLDVSLDVASQNSMSAPLTEIGEAFDSIISIADWLAVHLDLTRLSNLEGIAIELVIPSADSARHVLSMRQYYGLSEREATNVLVAEERSIPYVSNPESMNAALRAAIEDRNVPLLIAA